MANTRRTPVESVDENRARKTKIENVSNKTLTVVHDDCHIRSTYDVHREKTPVFKKLKLSLFLFDVLGKLVLVRELEVYETETIKYNITDYIFCDLKLRCVA